MVNRIAAGLVALSVVCTAWALVVSGAWRHFDPSLWLLTIVLLVALVRHVWSLVH